MKSCRCHRHAFTLIELSIVIVIIGLLVGGILGGKELIRSAELRSITTDANQYINAVNGFREQYRYLPGDMPSAQTYWPEATNGNADGLVTQLSVAAPAVPEERFQFWYHLYRAGLVDKPYNGAQGGGGANDFVFDENIPSSRVKHTGFAFAYSTIAASTTSYAVSGNLLVYGASMGSNAGVPRNAALVPIDAFGIDTKTDDGMPGTGKWVANGTGGGNFGTATGCSSADGITYNSTNTVTSCSFYIQTGY